MPERFELPAGWWEPEHQQGRAGRLAELVVGWQRLGEEDEEAGGGGVDAQHGQQAEPNTPAAAPRPGSADDDAARAMLHHAAGRALEAAGRDIPAALAAYAESWRLC